MQVLSLITLPNAIPIGAFQGQVGMQAVLEELNNQWKSGGAVVFGGRDAFTEKFAAFSRMVGEKIEDVKNTVLRSIEAVCAPNKFQAITCVDDLYNVPACMFIPILTAPDVRQLFDKGVLDGWGITADQLPEEDIYGRLINNGRFDTGSENYDRNAPISWTYQTGDPLLDREQLDAIETSRAFISTFLEEQMGEGGDEMDITNMPNRMGKLRQLKEV